jgi:hypothetical protein
MAEKKASPPTRGEVYVFGSDKGGVGKSLAAQAAITRLAMLNGRLPVVVEVEAEPRLGPVYGDAVRSFRVASNTLEEVERNPRLLYAIWNELGELLLDHEGEDVVIDLGANLTKPLSLWLNEFGEDGPLGAGERVLFYALATGEANALNSANNALAYAAQTLPRSRRRLLLNERDEHLFPINPDGPVVSRMLQEHGAELARLPRCMSFALAYVVDRRLRLDEALTHPVAWWAQNAGLTRMDATLATRRLVGWVDAAVRTFGPLPAEAAA